MTNEGKLQISPDVLKVSSVCSHFQNRISPQKRSVSATVCDIRPQVKKKESETRTSGGVEGRINLLLRCVLRLAVFTFFN